MMKEKILKIIEKLEIDNVNLGYIKNLLENSILKEKEQGKIWEQIKQVLENSKTHTNKNEIDKIKNKVYKIKNQERQDQKKEEKELEELEVMIENL